MKTLTQLPPLHRETSTTGCCSQFDPSQWDNRIIDLDRKLFVKATTRSLFYIPLNMGSAMRKAQARIDAAKANTDEFAILSQDVSPWRANHYIAVAKPLKDMDNIEISGTFLARVFEGAYQNAPKWHKELQDLAAEQGKTPLRAYLYYTTCPKCAKVYGKNYVVGLVQVAGPAPTLLR